MSDTVLNSDDIRQHAEAIAAKMFKDPSDLSPEAGQQTLHELHVHQIELEMQNEELRRIQVELEASRARYFDLYDLAPVGYLTLNEQGMIREANLTLVDLLGLTRKEVVQRPLTHFILPADQDIFYQHRRQLFAIGAPQVCELRLLRANDDPFWTQLEAIKCSTLTASQRAASSSAILACASRQRRRCGKAIIVWKKRLMNYTRRRRSLCSKNGWRP